MQNLIVTVLGRKGTGKTRLVQEVIREHRRVVVLDYLGEYGRDVDAEITYGRAEALEALIELEREADFVLSCRELDYDDTLDLLFVLRHLRRALIVVEEASWLCSPSSMPREVAWLVRYGRHQELSQVYVAQRPAMLHRDVTSQSDVLVSFHQIEQRDVDYLRAFMGEEAERVRELEPYAIVAGPPQNLARAPRAVRGRLPRSKKAVDAAGSA